MKVALYAMTAIVLLVVLTRGCPGQPMVDIEDRIRGHH